MSRGERHSRKGKQNKGDLLGRGITLIIESLIILMCFCIMLNFFFRTTLIVNATVSGHSMDYTLHDNEKLTYLKTNSFYNIEPKRFDIVVLDSPSGDGERYIKRVIGMPNDHLEYKNDKLYINGKLYEEPYLDKHKKEENFEMVNFKVDVPDGQYFVMGDNRQNSTDSRNFGTVHKEHLLGVKYDKYIPDLRIDISKVVHTFK